VPLHSLQVVSVAPGAAPLPPHVPHASVTGTAMGTLPPSAATRNGIETTVSTLSPRSGPPLRLAEPPPKMDENRSPSPPRPPERSPKSISSKRWPVPAPAGRLAGPGPRGPAPVNAPYFRSMSYCLRLVASDRTEYASVIVLKRSPALLSLGFASGCHFLASLR
jgi:hypothetical protein